MGSAKPVSIPKTVRLSQKPHEKPHTEPEDVVITMHERVKWDYPGTSLSSSRPRPLLIPGIFIPGTTSPALPAQTLSIITVIQRAYRRQAARPQCDHPTLESLQNRALQKKPPVEGGFVSLFRMAQECTQLPIAPRASQLVHPKCKDLNTSRFGATHMPALLQFRRKLR